MRATVEFNRKKSFSSPLPIVTIVIADPHEGEDITIKVSDEGGGISRSNMKHVWSYAFSTANPSIQTGFLDQNTMSEYDPMRSPLAGLGYGLPISRQYARYFGGDLVIMPMEGHGCDVFIYLNRLRQMSTIVT